MEVIKTDVLVIGAGAAGIRAALAASEAGAEVVLVAKGQLAQSGSTFSRISRGWGIQALVGEERTHKNFEAFYDEIIHVGLNQCDPKLVRILVEESGPCMNDLISYGVKFKKDSSGKYIRVKGCFSCYERAFVTEDIENIKQCFLSIIRRSPVKIMIGYAVDFVIVDGTCCGAWVVTGTEGLIKITSKSTVLATGGGAGIYMHHLVDDGQIGDGCAMVYRAGAELTNLEFLQFMLGLKKEDRHMFLPLGDLNTRDVLQDSRGCNLLDKYISDPNTRAKAINDRQNHFPFSCRDSSFLIDLSVAGEAFLGKRVFWRKNGPKESPPAVVHFSHAFNGGVKINEMAESTIPGLFAAGEVSAGPYGADRIGGCMMIATQVFGRRAGSFAALSAKRISAVPESQKIPEVIDKLLSLTGPEGSDEEVSRIRKLSKRCFSRDLMILRNEKGLKACLKEIESLDSSLEEIRSPVALAYLELKNALLVGKLITLKALRRKNSLGSHYRSDFSTQKCT